MKTLNIDQAQELKWQIIGFHKLGKPVRIELHNGQVLVGLMNKLIDEATEPNPLASIIEIKESHSNDLKTFKLSQVNTISSEN